MNDDARSARRLLLRAALFALGFSSVLTQLTLMRELLGVYAGNELTFGVILGNWLLLTGLGSWGGRSAARWKAPLKFLPPAQVVLALLPLAALCSVRLFRHDFFLRGATLEVTETVLSSFLLLMPYCVLSGYFLTLAATQLTEAHEAAGVGQSYLWDSVGSIAGGVAFSFLLVPWTNHFGILYAPAFLHLLLAAAGALHLRRRVLYATALACAAGLLALILTVDLDGFTTRREYAGQHVALRANSPYGGLVVTEAAGQYNFIENGVPLFATRDPAAAEETVHYALAQRPDAQKVLLLSGGVSGTAKEALKWGVARVDYVELDPLIVEAARRFCPEALDDPRIHVIHADGRRFVKEAGQPLTLPSPPGGEGRQQGGYGVIIVDLPEPSTSQINRFYTAEFFAAARRTLAPGGVLSTGLGHYENFVSPELGRMLAALHRTLKGVFRNVILVPGGRVYFLASDGPLTLDIAARIEAKGVRTVLVNRYFLNVVLAPDRLEDMARAVAGPGELNTDFSPTLYFEHLLYWVSQFKTRFGILIGALAILAALALWRIRAVPFAIFGLSFTATALQIVLLLSFQTLHGCLYRQLGALTAAFMAGLALGAGLMLSILGRPKAAGDRQPIASSRNGWQSPPPSRRRMELAWLQCGLGLFAALLPLLLVGLGRAGGGWADVLSAHVAFPVLIVLLATGEGLAFPLAAEADFDGLARTAARLYWADFAGGCLGALLVSTFLIPVLGVAAVCLVTAGLNLLGAGVVFISGRRRA
jgi:spermidine synthase